MTELQTIRVDRESHTKLMLIVLTSFVPIDIASASALPVIHDYRRDPIPILENISCCVSRRCAINISDTASNDAAQSLINDQIAKLLSHNNY